MKGKVGKPVGLQARRGHPASTTANPTTVVYPPSSTHKPAPRSASFAKGPQLPAGGLPVRRQIEGNQTNRRDITTVRPDEGRGPYRAPTSSWIRSSDRGTSSSWPAK